MCQDDEYACDNVKGLSFMILVNVCRKLLSVVKVSLFILLKSVCVTFNDLEELMILEM